MKDGQFAKKIRLVFEKDGKKYEIPSTDMGVPFWDENYEDWNWYWWESGNGSCDGNRSNLIHQFYPDFSEIDHCGKTIELIDWEVIKVL